MSQYGSCATSILSHQEERTCPWMKSVRHLTKQGLTSSTSKIEVKGPRMRRSQDCHLNWRKPFPHPREPSPLSCFVSLAGLVLKTLNCLGNEAQSMDRKTALFPEKDAVAPFFCCEQIEPTMVLEGYSREGLLLLLQIYVGARDFIESS